MTTAASTAAPPALTSTAQATTAAPPAPTTSTVPAVQPCSDAIHNVRDIDFLLYERPYNRNGVSVGELNFYNATGAVQSLA